MNMFYLALTSNTNDTMASELISHHVNLYDKTNHQQRTSKYTIL